MKKLFEGPGLAANLQSLGSSIQNQAAEYAASMRARQGSMAPGTDRSTVACSMDGRGGQLRADSAWIAKHSHALPRSQGHLAMRAQERLALPGFWACHLARCGDKAVSACMAPGQVQ
eukprot:363755-Chlamydomonas_euryale.AAC.6